MSIYEQALKLAREIKYKSGEAAALVGIGGIYLRRGNFKKAQKYYETSLKIAKESEDFKSEIASLNNIGAIYRKLGELERAERYHLDALRRSQKVGYKYGEAGSHINLGDLSNNIEEALQHYQDALELAREINHKWTEKDAFQRVDRVLLQLIPPEIRERYKKSHIPKKDTNGDGRIDRWAYLFPCGAPDRVEIDINGDGLPDTWIYHKCVKLETVGEKSKYDIKWFLMKQDMDYDGRVDVWEYTDGLEYISRIEFDTNRDGRVDEWAYYDRHTVTRVERDINHDGKADLIFRDADGDGKADGWSKPENVNPFDKFYTDAFKQLEGGNYQGFLNSIKGAYESSKDIDYETGKVISLANMGWAHLKRGNYEFALKYYKDALALSKKLVNRKEEATLLHDIGAVYLKLGDWDTAYLDTAFKYFQDALYLVRTVAMDNWLEANILGDIGSLYGARGKLKEAERYWQASYQLKKKVGNERGQATSLKNLGQLYRARGELRRALDNMEKAQELSKVIDDKSEEAEALMGISSVYAELGQLENALKYLEQSFRIAKEAGLHELAWQAQADIAKLYIESGQFEKGRAKCEEALQGTEEMREQMIVSRFKMRFMENISYLYQWVIIFSVGEDRLKDAFNYVERAKGRVLLDALQGGKIDVFQHMSEEEQRKEEQLSALIRALNVEIQKENHSPLQLIQLHEELKKARRAYENFTDTLYIEHSELAAKRGQVTSVTVDELPQLLTSDDMILLEYFVSEGITLLFTASVSKSSHNIELKVHEIPIGREDLEKKVSYLLDSLRKQTDDYEVTAAIFTEFRRNRCCHCNNPSRISVWHKLQRRHSLWATLCALAAGA